MQWMSAFSVMKGSDALFPNDFEEDLFLLLHVCLICANK